MYAAERQQAMTQLVRERGRISVVELAQQYDVTTETVRRDLSVLEDRNLVRRVHGGAVPADALTLIEAGLPDRDVSRIEQKQRIASAALDLLPRADSTVILDAGSTTVRLSRLLPPNLRMTVVTHAVPIAAQLAGSPQIELHLLPGRVRRHTHAAVGPETVEALDSIRADLAFVGTNGLTVEHGLSTPDRDRGRGQARDHRTGATRRRARRLRARSAWSARSSSPSCPRSTPSSPTRRSPPVIAGPSREPASR